MNPDTVDGFTESDINSNLAGEGILRRVNPELKIVMPGCDGIVELTGRGFWCGASDCFLCSCSRGCSWGRRGFFGHWLIGICTSGEDKDRDQETQVQDLLERHYFSLLLSGDRGYCQVIGWSAMAVLYRR